MLARLACLPRFKRLPTTLLLALAALGPRSIARGADTLPIGNLDARATGKVSSADVAPRGSLFTGLSVETATAVVPDGALAASAGDGSDGRAVLRDANRASVFLGGSLTDRFEITLGLHGSYEHVKPEERDALFPSDPTAATEDIGWRDSTKQTGFAGASVLLKLKLLEWEGLRLAVAPFVESGAGDQATYSLTRSVGPKAGFMSVVTYGAPGVADVSLNAGYRYRDPEVLGDVTLRHEQFAKAEIKAYASRDFSLFIAGEGRRLMVADAGAAELESSRRDYIRQESGEVRGGFSVRLGDTELAAFGGGRPKHAGGFGFGKTSYGLAVAMPLGERRGPRGGRSIGAEIESGIEKEKNDKAAAQATQAAAAAQMGPPAPPADPYPEMIGAGVDPLEALAEGDDAPDFKDAKARELQYQKDAAVESEDAKVERELQSLKAAEEQAAQDLETRRQAERAKARQAAAAQSQEDDALMREWLEEAKQEADALDAIGRDEMEWNGLE